jgi:hypothetical protein
MVMLYCPLSMPTGLTVIVVVAPEAVGVTFTGLNVTVDPPGSPDEVMETCPEYPLIAFTVTA